MGFKAHLDTVVKRKISTEIKPSLSYHQSCALVLPKLFVKVRRPYSCIGDVNFGSESSLYVHAYYVS